MAVNVEIQRIDKSQESSYLDSIQSQGYEHLGEPLQIEFNKDINEIRIYVQTHAMQLGATHVTEVENPPVQVGQTPMLVYYIWKAPISTEPQPFACPYCTRPFMAIPGPQTQVVACPTCGGANIIPPAEIPAPPAVPPTAPPTAPPAAPAPVAPAAAPAPPEPAPTEPAAQPEQLAETKQVTEPTPPPAPSAPTQEPTTSPESIVAAPTTTPPPEPTPPTPAPPAATTAPPTTPAEPAHEPEQPPSEVTPPPAPVPAPPAPAAPAQPAPVPSPPAPAPPAPTTALTAPTPAPTAPTAPTTAPPTTTTPTGMPATAQPEVTQTYEDSGTTYDESYYEEYKASMPSFDYFSKKVETVEKKPTEPLIPMEYENSYNTQFKTTEQAIATNMKKLAELLGNPRNQIKFYDSGELMYPKVTIRKSAYTHLDTRDMDLLMIKDGVNDYKIIANESHGAAGGTLMPMQDELFAIKTLGHASYRAMEDWAYLDDNQKQAVSKCIYAFAEIYVKKLPPPEEEEETK